MKFVKGVLYPWNWKKYEGDVVVGVSCDGDPGVAPTTGRLSWALGVLWRWKTVAILKAKFPEIVYTGFVAYGDTKVCNVPVPAGSAFAMLIGHEKVTFFAVTLVQGQWQPVELMHVARVRRSDPAYKNVPLY